MGDAVIVSAARTAIGTARRGSLVDFTAFDLAKFSIGEALKRSGHPGRRRRRHRPRRGPPGRRRHRPLRRDRARPRRRAGHRAQPALRVGHGGGADRRGQHPRRHGHGRDRGRDREPDPFAAGLPEAARHRTAVCSSGCRRVTPQTPDAPTMDMSITVGWNTAQKCNVTREEQDHWAYHSHMRAVAAIDEGRFEDEIFAARDPRREGRGTHLRRRRAPAPRHDRREARRAPAAAPGDPRLLDHRGQLVGPQRRRLRDRAHRLRLRAGERARAAGHRALVGVGGRAAGRHRSRPDARDPEGAAACRPRGRRRRRSSRSTRRSRRWRVASSRILGFPHEIVNVNGSGCSLGHPVACTGARMITTLTYELRRRGGGYGVASMCAGGGMGSATVIEVMAPQ